MNFAETQSYLLSLGHEILAMKLGLRSSELLLERLGNPHKSFASVQIAGTNGKGSTAVVLNSICRAAGVSTGLYTSPHLVSITERITIDGNAITEDNFANYASVVRTAAAQLVAEGTLEALPTFFEHVTAIAFLAFRETGIKLAILETGLGGRLDATTVAEAGTVAITPVALDHQEYLGQTLVEIAAEKAAIIRPGVTAIVAPQRPRVLEVILRRAAECNVRPSVNEWTATIDDVTDDGRFTVTFETKESGERYEKVLLGLRGEHQIMNVAVAIQLAESLRGQGLQISNANIVKGVESACHPGRLELHQGRPAMLFDGAHNPSAAQALRAYLKRFVKGPLTIVFGAMNDKRLAEMSSTLFPLADQLVLTKPYNPRSAALDTLQSLAESILVHQKITPTQTVSEAVKRARELTPDDGLICVTGSLYLVGEAKALMEQANCAQICFTA